MWCCVHSTLISNNCEIYHLRFSLKNLMSKSEILLSRTENKCYFSTSLAKKFAVNIWNVHWTLWKHYPTLENVCYIGPFTKKGRNVKQFDGSPLCHWNVHTGLMITDHTVPFLNLSELVAEICTTICNTYYSQDPAEGMRERKAQGWAQAFEWSPCGLPG